MECFMVFVRDGIDLYKSRLGLQLDVLIKGISLVMLIQ